MGRRDGSAAAISCSDGPLSLAAGYFDMGMIKKAIAEYFTDVAAGSSHHLHPVVVSAGAWLSTKLHELHEWNRGLLTLNGGTIIINHSYSSTVTMLSVDVLGGGSVIFSAQEKPGGTLLLHLTRKGVARRGLQLVFQGCEKQFACYDPMADMTLVGLMPDGETPHGWAALRLDGNPWNITHPTYVAKDWPYGLRREWRADGHDSVMLELSC